MKISASVWSLSAQLIFLRRLALLLDSGMVLPKALRALVTSRAKSGGEIAALLVQVEQGKNLSQALRVHSRMFSDLSLGLIEIGEASGTLSVQLRRAADLLERKLRLRNYILGMCLYPLCVLMVGVIVLGLVVGFVVPKMAPALLAMRLELPVSTRVLLSASQFLSDWGWWVFLLIPVCAFLIWGWRAWVVQQITKSAWHLPLVSRFVRQETGALATRVLSALLVSGIGIISATKIAAGAIVSPPWQRALFAASQSVGQGQSLSQSLHDGRVLPELALDLIRAGELSGRLPESLEAASQFLEEEAQANLKRLLVMLEPALLLMLGLVVGFVALSVVGPVYDFTKRLTP